MPRYAVNCVHPTVVEQVFERNPDAVGRVTCFSGNISARSVDELEGLEELDVETPALFAKASLRLVRDCRVRAIGGCCGTNPEHTRAIAELILDADCG